MSTERVPAALPLATPHHSPRVLVSGDPAHRGLLADRLALRGYEAKCSGSEEDLIGIVLQHAPDVVVYLLTDGSHWDLAVLQLLRRVRPLVPLILVSADASVRMRLAVLGLRPTYLAMSPEETGEILEAIEAVLR